MAYVKSLYLDKKGANWIGKRTQENREDVDEVEKEERTWK